MLGVFPIAVSNFSVNPFRIFDSDLQYIAVFGRGKEVGTERLC
jgi:hypothetical protein